jgi:hypothetical protein
MRTSLHFRAVGVTFMPGYPDTLHRLHELAGDAWARGESVSCVLLRDPDNAADPNAVQIHVPAIGRVGMVPAVMAAPLAARMDDGHMFQAEIVGVAIDPDHPELPGLDVAVVPVDSEPT